MAPAASHLYPHLRIHQIFGANTDVGKTIFATALALASAAVPVKGQAGSSSVALDKDGYPTQHAGGERVHYIKPVSTGPLSDADSSHLSRFAPNIDAHTIFQFNDPVSPHVAAARYYRDLQKSNLASQKSSAQGVPSDKTILSAISAKISEFAVSGDGGAAAYVETAGGVHSPTPAGSSTASMLRPLRLPTILIGDSNLGGISTTKSAYDSLIMAGYDVEAMLLFSDADRGWENADYLMKWGEEMGLRVWGVGGPSNSGVQWGPPPNRHGSQSEDQENMRRYYAGLVTGRGEAAANDEAPTGLVDVIEHLRQRHRERIANLATMAARTRQHCWWPFTQHLQARTDKDVNVIDSAYGDFFHVYSHADAEKQSNENLLQPLLDGSASWWTQCLGHADASLTLAAARAAGRYGHVLFPMCANEPSLALSETLLGCSKSSDNRLCASPGAGWASRVFFSDDGSTGMEVAIKMALSSAKQRYDVSSQDPETKKRTGPGRAAGYMGGRPNREWKILGLQGSYHGDTIGAMDASEPSVFNSRVEWYRGRGDWFAPPCVGVSDGVVNIELPLKDSQWQSLDGLVDAKRAYPSLSDVYDVEARLQSDPLSTSYRDLIYKWLDHLTRVEQQRYGALILEPLVMGAGGMIFVDPLFQRCFVDVVRANPELFSQLDPPLHRPSHVQHPSSQDQSTWHGLPIIFDEVFAGLYRLGYATPAEALGIRPDISVLAKILTGGMVPMSVTLATSSIFESFTKSEQKADALLHGHSYTAHPIGCEIARQTLRSLGKLRANGAWDAAAADWKAGNLSGTSSVARECEGRSKPWSFWSSEAVKELSQKTNVESAMALGCVLSINLRDVSEGGGYSSSASADLVKRLRHQASASGHPEVSFNIHARPLGNVIYLMSSLNTPVDVLRNAERALLDALQ